jgi:hypothetical protein
MTPTTTAQGGAGEAPIACTLTSADYRSRLDDLAGLAARALRSREPIDGGERLTFAADPSTEDELRSVIAAEAACCSFLTMTLARRDGALVLDVVGPADARPIITELFA